MEHTLGCVYTDAVSNGNGFMTWKPHRKRHGFEGFTRNLSNPAILFSGLCASSLDLGTSKESRSSWRYASRFIQSKIPESCKSEVKPQIKVVIVQQSAALRARLTIFTSRDSQFRARPFSNRCGFAVYTTSKPYRFENAPLLKAYSKRPGFDNELGRLRVNERCNRIETDAVTNETASV